MESVWYSTESFPIPTSKHGLDSCGHHDTLFNLIQLETATKTGGDHLHLSENWIWNRWYHNNRNEWMTQSTVITQPFWKHTFISFGLFVDVLYVLLKDFKLEPSMLSLASTVVFLPWDPNPPFIAECSLDLESSSHNFSALILLLSPQLITNQSIHRAHLMSSFFCATLGADLWWVDSRVP